ncbi:MAG: FAD/NAD(P)-binding protein [Planctomycetota bacterium]
MSCGCKAEKDIYRPEPARVLETRSVTELENYFRFKLESGEPFGHRPGQFAQVSVPGIGEAPISISSSPSRNDGFEMVVRKMGNVTGAMHQLKDGDEVGIRGPYGTEFPVDDAMKGQDVLFIAGGIGLVPLRSAIQYVLDNRDNYGRVIILYGAKTPAERLFVQELLQWQQRDDVEYLDTVDRAGDRWQGNTGVITTLMPKISIDPAEIRTVVCGPPVMYKFVLMELFEMDVPHENIFVSLERHMKCGVGKCGHCQINGVYVCQDGPVFNYADIEGFEEAIQ